MGILQWFEKLQSDFYKNIIMDNRYEIIIEGFLNTISIAAVACIIGVVIGTVVALVKVQNHFTGRWKLPKAICNFYLAIIRGTPVVLQLLISFYIIFVWAPLDKGVYVAMLTFGVNSGAYVAEIIRAGIMSVDMGQIEAGRSLGFSHGHTMWYIVLPQAIKNVIPPLFNEFIVLLKETSVAGYVAVRDLTRAAEIIRSRTFSAFFPLIVVACIYLALVLGLTKVQNIIEAKMAQTN